MCGFVFYKSIKKNVDVLSTTKKMLDKIEHRGPDGSNLYYYEEQNLALGHNRLAIIDLDERADQPLLSKCKNVKLVFNGEIYNYKEIRSDLIKEGYAFFTNSDTEVVLNSYLHYGISCFDEFDGMFSVVIVDDRSSEIIISRDSRGVKPLYIYKSRDEIILGSELKCFNHIFSFENINKVALSNFLVDGYINGESTPFNDINKFKKGTSAVYDLNSLKLLGEFAIESKVVTHECLYDSVVQGVKSRFVSDVPVGIFLSGGIDSTLVAAIAKRELGFTPVCFTLGLENDSRDESTHAEKIASDLGLEHKIIKVDNNIIRERIKEIFKVYDEPFADISSVLTLILSEFASNHVKVALSADGGDELFFGYKRQQYYNNHLITILRNNSITRCFGSLFFGVLGDLFNSKSYKCFKASSILGIKDEIKSYRHYNGTFNSNELLVGITNDEYSHPFEFDFQDYMPNDIFQKVDRASMRFGLEAREPLMHNSIYMNSNMRHGKYTTVGKKDLKEILLGIYPEYEVIEKSGFSFSLEKNADFLFDEDSIDWDLIASLNLINRNVVKRLKAKQQNKNSSEIQKLFFLFVLCGWFKTWCKYD
ncbi:asparagine synthase (glutamine-hydrolyzing) [Vibrio cortegadensis]|uniref:asparagine synthase (glutamine-hydrolyzing) n=1 Tax=Vibrio cortegadensis TaxID=1328770 RepID=A0ABV4M6Z5_9VIBR